MQVIGNTDPTMTTGAPTAQSFLFSHKAFALGDVHFTRDSDGSGALMHLTLDGMRAAISLRSLHQAFDITPGSEDGRLLALIPRALRFVSQIRPGDAIPREVIDGQPSWGADRKYLTLANARLTGALVAWLRGEQFDPRRGQHLLELANDESTKTRVREAVATIADALGYPADRRTEVLSLVEKIGVELSYIEALRDRLHYPIRRILGTLQSLERVYRRDRAVLDEIERSRVLLGPPSKGIAARFEEIDAKMARILATLREFERRVAQIRRTRDELRSTELLWQGTLDLWHGAEPIASREIEQAIKETYRFAARNFTSAGQWTLTNR
jgi:hypothetical protein